MRCSKRNAVREIGTLGHSGHWKGVPRRGPPPTGCRCMAPGPHDNFLIEKINNCYIWIEVLYNRKKNKESKVENQDQELRIARGNQSLF